MSNTLYDIFATASSGANSIRDPGDGFTIPLESKAFGVCRVSAGIRYMPPMAPTGVMMSLIATGSQTTILDSSNNVVDYLYLGDVHHYISSGSGKWSMVGGPAVSRLASGTIPLAKGGAVPSDLLEPRERGGRLEGRGTIVAGSDTSGALIEGENGSSENSYGQCVSDKYLLGGQTLSSPLHVNHSGEEDVAHAISIYGKASVVKNNQIELFKGTGILVSGDSGEAPSLPTNPVNYVRENVIQRCFNGIVTTTADAEVFNNTVAIVRDYCCWVKGGNTKVYGNHFWGAGLAAMRLGVDGTSGAMQMDLTDASDAVTGCIVSSNACKITNCYSQGCITNFQVVGTAATIANTNVRVSRNSDFNPDNSPLTGIHFESTAHGGKALGCTIIMDTNGPAAETPNIGLLVETHAVDINGLTILGDASNNVTGLKIDAPNLMGGIYHVTATGFTGTSAVAVHIASWGDNNTLYIRGLAAEGGSPPTSAGTMVRIAADDWGTNNKIFVNGVELTADDAYAPA